MSGERTFDVQVLTGRSGWISMVRAQGLRDARTEVRVLQARDKYEAVRIVQENYDFEKNEFARKTVFTETRGEARLREAQSDNFDDFAEQRLAAYHDDDDFDLYYDYEGFLSTPREKLLAAVAALIVLAMLGTGIYLANDKAGLPAAQDGRFFVYELPTVITNAAHGDKTYSVRLDLKLELGGPEDVPAIELVLDEITQTVIEQLRVTDAQDLFDSGGMQGLQAEIRRQIQEKLPGNAVHGVLFDNIHVE